MGAIPAFIREGKHRSSVLGDFSTRLAVLRWAVARFPSVAAQVERGKQPIVGVGKATITHPHYCWEILDVS